MKPNLKLITLAKCEHSQGGSIETVEIDDINIETIQSRWSDED